jgi:type VI secretion system protein ImpK
MSSDDFDRTIFRQPDASSDQTIIRPMPGGDRRATNHVTPSARPVAAMPQPRYDVQMTPAGMALMQPTHGLNPLVDAASVLITVYEKTRQSSNHSNVDGLHQVLVSEIQKFENNARLQGISAEILLAARYLLCTVLDEAVLNTPWGAESLWPQRTLLSTFHNETSGGEKFFLILDRLRNSPMENLQILELIYLLLSLGYEGKYKFDPRGRDSLQQIRDDLFATIRSYRGDGERTLASHWQGLGWVNRSLVSYVPIWVVFVSVAVILVITYSGFKYGLHLSSEPAAQQLMEISKISSPTK